MYICVCLDVCVGPLFVVAGICCIAHAMPIPIELILNLFPLITGTRIGLRIRTTAIDMSHMELQLCGYGQPLRRGGWERVWVFST